MLHALGTHTLFTSPILFLLISTNLFFSFSSYTCLIFFCYAHFLIHSFIKFQYAHFSVTETSASLSENAFQQAHQRIQNTTYISSKYISHLCTYTKTHSRISSASIIQKQSCESLTDYVFTTNACLRFILLAGPPSIHLFLLLITHHTEITTCMPAFLQAS